MTTRMTDECSCAVQGVPRGRRPASCASACLVTGLSLPAAVTGSGHASVGARCSFGLNGYDIYHPCLLLPPRLAHPAPQEGELVFPKLLSQAAKDVLGQALSRAAMDRPTVLQMLDSAWIRDAEELPMPHFSAAAFFHGEGEGEGDGLGGDSYYATASGNGYGPGGDLGEMNSAVRPYTGQGSGK